MDKDCVVRMLLNIRDNKYLGPKTDDSPIGELVAYALEKRLINRSDTGNLILTDKGCDLLEEKVSWENL
ncbi:MAG TPA: hypothetical protein VG367_13155 [Mucilaginibacter sp.]|jgi:hypothetical protein|nr:hypothetical protein [Mucilaginibacter sp.]